MSLIRFLLHAFPLGLYFGLGVVAIGAVAWLKGYVGRSGHA